VIDAETPLAILAVHEAIYEVFHVAAGLPHPGMGDNRAFDPHDVVVQLHH